MANNKYYQVYDGWFTFWINAETGQSKFELSDGDEVVNTKLDDFSRKEEI